MTAPLSRELARALQIVETYRACQIEQSGSVPSEKPPRAPPRKVASFRLSTASLDAISDCQHILRRQWRSPRLCSGSRIIETAVKLYLAALEEAIASKAEVLPGETPRQSIPPKVVEAYKIIDDKLGLGAAVAIRAIDKNLAQERARREAPAQLTAPPCQPAAAPP